MAAELGYKAGQILCDKLISEYQKMEQYIKKFETVMGEYRESLDDKIMKKSEETLDQIKADMREINQYISEFTKDKKEALIDAEFIEESFRT